MTGLRQRLRRLLRQNAIRLSAGGLRPVEVRRGDRLAIASRWWRVRRAVCEPSGGPAVALDLVAEDAPELSARIRLPDASGTCSFDDGRSRVRLRWREILHVPAPDSRSKAEDRLCYNVPVGQLREDA